MSTMIELIKVLRDRTGAGMMDCKHALVESNNDIEQAIAWLREKGIAKQAKKASSIAAEGKSLIKVDGNKACVVEINCETDFVASSDPFIELIDLVAGAILANSPKSNDEVNALVAANGQTVEQLFVDATVKLGEKLSFRRFVLVEKAEDELFGAYMHNKGAISALVVLKGGDATLAKQLSMSVAANAPYFLSFADIPAEEIEKEHTIQVETAKEDPSFGKKPQVIQDKIIEGRVNKHFESQVFLSQEFVVNPEKKVEQVLAENKASVTKFVRYQVGEGLEKRQDDFAKEVAEQMK